VDWQQKSYNVSSGIHTLKWVYSKNSSGYSGDDCGWIDYVQWTGPSPQQDTSNWQKIEYKHDLTGRRNEKKVDGFSTRYVYDGPQVIAEYDGNNNLLRKYIYGPGIDQPVCMIEVADSNAVYYYHFDALGSVVALSDSSGDTVQTYEYSVYGQVAVEDINHPNPYMFAGRRFDIEIGLYYNRSRYYNPYTGRFLQADPSGYEDDINLYRYCKNNPLVWVDPLGLKRKKDPVSSLYLIFWYFWGRGEPLTYYGDAAKIVLGNTLVQNAVAEYLRGAVTAIRTLPFELRKSNGVLSKDMPVILYQGDGGYTDWPPERFINGAILHMNGTWKVDRDERIVTFNITYELHDIADLHPYIPSILSSGYFPDSIGKLIELWWNWGKLLPGQEWSPSASFVTRRYAQKYDIIIECGTITTTLKWGGSVSRIISGWPPGP